MWPHLSPIPKGHDLGWAYVVLGDVGSHKGHIVVPQSLKLGITLGIPPKI
jgi:hypothetical protein